MRLVCDMTGDQAESQIVVPKREIYFVGVGIVLEPNYPIVRSITFDENALYHIYA